MTKVQYFAGMLCILLLSACATNRVNVYTTVPFAQAPDLSSGYVAGLFSRDWGSGSLGFGIVNVDTAAEYVISFGTDSRLQSSIRDEVGMIQIPPGNYRIAYWLTYSTLDREKRSQNEIPADSAIGSTFAVAPGEILFIGSYAARLERDQNGGNNAASWTIMPQQIALPTANKAIAKRYPEFSTLPLSCQRCIK